MWKIGSKKVEFTKPFDSMDSMKDRINENSKLGEDNKWKWGQER
jgi:hypothetical protein